jgi:hypothetical protein
MLASGQKPVGKEERGSSVHLTPSLQSTAQSPIQHWDTALLPDNASLDPSSNNAQAPPQPKQSQTTLFLPIYNTFPEYSNIFTRKTPIHLS